MWKLGPHRVWGCPQQVLKDEGVQRAITAWGRWKRYGLPYAGGWAEQPAVAIDLIDVCEIEWCAVEETMRQRDGQNR